MNLKSLVESNVLQARNVTFRYQHGKHQALRPVQTASRPKKVDVFAQTSTEEPISARKSGLALMLDDGTRKSHSVAENTEFVSGFFKGIATKDSFAKLVQALYFVYLEMETVFEETTDANVRALDYKELRRTKALEDDMAYYFGEDWKSVITPSAATQKYIDRIRQVAEENPELLIAHQYTRYLGDLFGGQMMGGMATRSLKLEEGKVHGVLFSSKDMDGCLCNCVGVSNLEFSLQGVKFYQFDDISSTKDFIEEWYTSLNSLELSLETKQAIVDEGNLVFRLNIDIFSELEGNAFGSFLRVAWTSFKEKYLT